MRKKKQYEYLFVYMDFGCNVGMHDATILRDKRIVSYKDIEEIRELLKEKNNTTNIVILNYMLIGRN